MKGCVGVSECLGTDLFHKFQTSRYEIVYAMVSDSDGWRQRNCLFSLWVQLPLMRIRCMGPIKMGSRKLIYSVNFWSHAI